MLIDIRKYTYGERITAQNIPIFVLHPPYPESTQDRTCQTNFLVHFHLLLVWRMPVNAETNIHVSATLRM